MDDKAQLPEGPFGTFAADFPKDEPLLACAWAARSLVDTLSTIEFLATRDQVKLKSPLRGDKKRHSEAQQRTDEFEAKLIRAWTMALNRDMRELTQRINAGYDQYARTFYEDTGVSVDNYVGTCWAEIALQLGKSVYFAMAIHTNPQSVLPSTINQAYVPLDPDAVVKSFDEVRVAVCQGIEGISRKGLKQLSVAMLNEHTKVQEKLFPVSTNRQTSTAAMARTEGANESSWPMGTGWEFRLGQAAFQGKPFAITGKPVVILKRLAEMPGEPVLKSILRDIIDPDSNAEEGCVRDSITEARAILRKAFMLGNTVDPIPNLARGPDAAWKLDENVFRIATKNPR